MRIHNTLVVLSLLLGIISCKKPDKPAPNTITDQMKKDVVTNYAAIVYASYQDSYQQALQLRSAAQTFFNAPSEASFSAVKTAWLNARIPYEQTEAFRFYGGPIDEAKGPEPLLNSWPMDEAYIDYVLGNASAGIINDPVTYPVISKRVLDSLNTLTGETEVSCGYHAIEFLLWGQDFNVDGPGNRPYTDYVSGGTAANQDRRKAYLLACIDLLIDNLKTLVDAWDPSNASNYRATFVANADNSISLLLTGMGSLAKGELVAERMVAPLTSHSQEDEHSCFSDNTDQDLILCQQSIYNVYTGRYVRTDGSVIDGMGINDLVKVQHSDLNDQMTGKLDAATTALKAIPHPFDQDILGTNPDGEQKVQNAINAVKAEADFLVQVAKTALGITLIIS